MLRAMKSGNSPSVAISAVTSVAATGLARVVEASTNPGDLVIDPFLGSGTTAAVAVRLGRRVLGYELDPAWVRVALKRLKGR